MEQEQEGQRDLVQPRGLSSTAICFAALLSSALLLPACGRGEAGDQALGPAANIHLEGRRAWTGGQEGGPFLLVEEMSQAAHASATIGGEEELFRSTFSIPADTRLLRVQLMADEAGQALGEVLVDGIVFTPLGNPPEEVDARARLYWNGVTSGVQKYLSKSSQATRATYLIAAPSAPALASDATLQWHRGETRIDLSARNWSEPQRRAYLDAPADFTDE